MESPIKWAGGKSLLIGDLKELVKRATFERYVDPFCGSLALPLECKFPRCWLNDINSSLVGAYEAIRDDAEVLITETNALLADEHNNKERFYELRREYNTLKQQPVAADGDAKRRLSSLFMYLNQRGFSGLYRESSKGRYNVPYRRYNVSSLDASNVRAVHDYLATSDVKLSCLDYKEVLMLAEKGDLVYLDPPYYPSAAASFTSYWRGGFSVAEQEELCALARALDAKGAQFILSNSPCDEVKRLYAGFNMRELHVARPTRSDLGKRTHNDAPNELLVWNF